MKTTVDRFWEKVRKTPTCWLWTAADNGNGYGVFWDGNRQTYAHRFSYELHKGPIPEGLTIDHLCKVQRCVNPDHLEAVTQRVNLLRGNTVTARKAAQTHCVRGHSLSEDVYIFRGCRMCRPCRRLAMQRLRDRRKGIACVS